MSIQDENTYQDTDDETEYQPDDEEAGDEEEEEGTSRRSKRRRTVQPVAQIPEVNTDVLGQVQDQAKRDILESTVQAMVEDYYGIMADPVWRQVNQAWGNERVLRFFQGGHPLPPPQPRMPVPASQRFERGTVQRDFADAFHHEMLGEHGKGRVPADGSEPEGLFQKGANQPGSWMKRGETAYVEGPRNYSAEYDISVAHGLAQSVINSLIRRGKKVTEIQLMVLDDRVLVSANEKSAVKALVNQAVNGVIDGSTSGLEEWAKARQLNTARLRSVLRGGSDESTEDLLVKMAASSNIYPEQRQALTILMQALKTDQLFVNAGSDPGPYVTNAAGSGKVILVDSGPFCHAEQNILAAFARSGYGGSSATVAGGKRPCAGCHVALVLVQWYVFPGLRFVQGHGGAWYNSIRGSLKKLAEAADVSIDLVTQTAQLVLPEAQYATALNDDAPEIEKVTDLRARVIGEKVATDRLPFERPTSPGLVDDYKGGTPDPAAVRDDEEEEEENYSEITPSLEIPDSQENIDLPIPPDGWKSSSDDEETED